MSLHDEKVGENLLDVGTCDTFYETLVLNSLAFMWHEVHRQGDISPIPHQPISHRKEWELRWIVAKVEMAEIGMGSRMYGCQSLVQKRR